jgi:uroporphyrinogen decarboxylase
MLPRERVIRVINHQKPDRIPVYGWVRANLEDQVKEVFGSVVAFEDKYEFDYAHIFGGPSPYSGELLSQLRKDTGGAIDPGMLMDVPMCDPDDMDKYNSIRDQISHHKEKRGRFVYVQTPGLFECLNGVFGIQNHLSYLLLYEEELHHVYKRQAEWNKAFANNCIDLGVDMIHVSDDWGMQKGLMFSPEAWWKLMYPYHKIVCDEVKRRGVYISLHSDGNVSSVLDGIVKLGYNVVHPYQESAGMNLYEYKRKYINSFSVMGGLDVQTTIGFGKLDFLKQEIKRVLSLFADGGLLYCTSHFVQDHCSMDELVFAFDTIYQITRELADPAV